jgi:putative spermidine/putrescine transport system ATP-binding protein/spermidine/putrescine transport system ATP-binding protein
VPSPALELQGLTKRFGSTAAVDRVNLTVAPGEFVTLLGPSGCGKTTTLNLIAGFITADEGEIMLAGETVGERPPFRRDLGLVFQDYALFPHMTVAENVGFGLKMRKVKALEIERRVSEALAMVKLAGLGARRPLQLSGGQRQRVALARALVIRPAMLLLDEPLSNLDLKLREEMRGEISSLQRRLGIATVFVTHDQGEALTMSDRIAVMRSGRIEQIGTPTDIYERPTTRFVASFIGAINILAAKVESVEPTGLARLTASAGPAVVRLPSGLAPGAAVTMTVRPERLRLAAPGTAPAGGTTWPATVDSVVYLGARRELRVRLADGTIAIAEATNDGQRAWSPGDTVVVWFTAEDAWIIAEAASA